MKKHFQEKKLTERNLEQDQAANCSERDQIHRSPSSQGANLLHEAKALLGQFNAPHLEFNVRNVADIFHIWGERPPSCEGR